MIDQTDNNETKLGVSSVIGVILMIALTVILATVVGTYAFDLAGSVLSEPPQASVTFSDDYDQFNGVYTVEAVLNSAPNVERVELKGDLDTSGDCVDALEDDGKQHSADLLSGGSDYNPQISEVGSSVSVCVSSAGGDVRAVGVTDGGNAQVISTHSVSEES